MYHKNMGNEKYVNILTVFQKENNIITTDDFIMLIYETRLINPKDFLFGADDLLSKDMGWNSGNHKKILNAYGITPKTTIEDEHVSHSNTELMIKYIEFLNEWHKLENIDLDEVEQFWAEQVKEYFRNQPFTLSADTSRTIAASLDELFEQARKRQKQNPGTQYLGAILQHLVAAKLSTFLPEDKFQIHGASVADSPTERSGDFVINNTIIHCTTAPSEPLIQKCKANIRSGCFPVIITIFDRVKNACDLAIDADISGRVEVWDIQQFLSTNINEHGLFDEQLRTTKLADILERYNHIIDKNETDPSLKIEFEAK